jgi:hypothetical protein
MKTIDRFAHVLPVALLLAAGLVALAGDHPAPQRPTPTGPAKPADAKADGSAAASAAPAPVSDTTVPALRAPFAPPVRKTQTGKTVVVITNGDLERMFGKSRQQPPRSNGANGNGDDAVQSALPADMNAGQPPGVRNPADIQAEISRLEKKAKHIKNPYVTPVPEGPDERAAEHGMSAPQKLQAAQQRIEQLKQELQKQGNPPPPQQN